MPAEILRDIANRVLIAVPTLLLVSVFVFLLQKLSPDDPILLLLISVDLGWLPASGYESPWVDPRRSFQTMLMPSIMPGAALAA